MLKSFAKLIFILALIFDLSDICAQSRRMQFQHLTIEDGLPQNMIECMLQDKQGFMWFGTWNGLCRYDGYGFETFEEEGKTQSLDNTFIYALEEDAYGNIWVGTRQGLSAYIYDRDVFQTPQLNQNFSEIKSLEVFQDSVLIVGSQIGVTFLRIIDEKGTIDFWKHIGFGEGNLFGTIVNKVFADSWGNVWVATDQGLTVFPTSGSESRHYQVNWEDAASLSSNMVLSICETRNKDVWVGTETGLNKYDPVEDRFIRYYSNLSVSNTLVHNTIMDLVAERDRLVVATLGGISVLDITSNQITNYLHDFNAPYSLSNDFVNCLYRDRSDNIWIGTERGGVNYFNIRQNLVEHYEFQPDDPDGLSSSTINSIYEDDRYLWVGTAGGGLNRYDKKRQKFKHYKFRLDDPEGISSDFITGIRRGSDGKLWVSTWGSGVNIMEADGRFSKLRLSDGLVSDYISSMAEDKMGNVWIGTLGGLSKYDVKSGAVSQVFSDQTNPKMTNIGCLLFDAENSLWVGTRHGLFHLQSQDGSFDEIKIKRYTNDPAQPSSISGDYVISIHQSDNGDLWVGTYGHGLNRLTQEADSVSFTSFSTRDGLSNTVVYGILEDDEHNLWLSTDYGLSRFNIASHTVRNFYQADGLLNNQYYWSAAFRNKNGKLFFGGMNGLDAFYPDWIKEDVVSNEVVITDIRLLNESVKPMEEYNGVAVIKENPSEAQDVEISYKEKAFGVEFSSLNFEESEVIRYAYILEGFESDWNYVSSNRRYASYTNLTPGRYTFKVKASGTGGEFSGAPKVIRLTIVPPFWETLWFRVLALLVLIGLVYAYVRYRTYSLKKQKQILEHEVQERTERINQQNEALSFQAVQLRNNNQELEDNQKLIEGQNEMLENQNKEILTQRDDLLTLNKQLKHVSQLKLSFFTNISHEFRTPLTLILGPLEKLVKEKNLSGEVKNSLQIMNRNAQRLLHLINQIMDFRKIEKGRMELKVSEGNLSEFCRELFKAFQPLAEIKRMEFEYAEENLPKSVWMDAAKLENILYNLLSNAFKYTPNGGRVSMEVMGLSLEQSKLSLDDALIPDVSNIVSVRISDSGIGISKEDLPLVFKRFYRIESEEAFKISGSGIGLALTEELIKTYHGEVFVESELGKGSVFEIQFPCLKGSYISEGTDAASFDNPEILTQIEVLKNEFLEGEVDSTAEDQEAIRDKDKPTVLVVEDNADLRTFITHKLEDAYNVLEAENGLLGLEKAESGSPDIIISDVMMPKMDGLELCAALKGNLGTSHIPFILLTAKSAIEDQIQGIQIGADDYLSKPFSFELLEAKIQNFIESRKKLREQFLKSSDLNIAEVTTNSRDQKFLEQALQIVTDNLSNSEFGVKEFVEALGISRSLLHKKLTNLTSQSAAEFINHLRMKKSQDLLREQSMNISEVAYAVGYNDPKYFSRVFSKTFGQSPKDFIDSLSV
jgi:signal transduction histidine kinase/ligand-binding sensor domain-containing protein/DNA-binding response OmpR family regulator